jgi:hypothetical protein
MLATLAALALCWLAAARQPAQDPPLPPNHPPVQPQLPPNHPQVPQMPANHPDVGRPPPVPAEPKDSGEPVVVPQPNPEDVKSIDSIVKAYYASLCGAKGQGRDWNRLRSLMFPDMRFITTRPMDNNLYAPMILSLEQFIAVNTTYFERGGYFERESHRKVDQFGTIAQVFSTYESRHDVNEPVPYSRGINSMQLLNDGSRWWIVNIVWDYEREDNPLPQEHGGAPAGGG